MRPTHRQGSRNRPPVRHRRVSMSTPFRHSPYTRWPPPSRSAHFLHRLRRPVTDGLHPSRPHKRHIRLAARGGQTYDPCSSSRDAFMDRHAPRDPDGNDPGAKQRRRSEVSTGPEDDPPSLIASQQGMCSLDSRCLIEGDVDQPFRWSEPVWSPPPESNRRPHPYHGTTRNRCADRRCPSSRPTVRAEVIGSPSAQLCGQFRFIRVQRFSGWSSGGSDAVGVACRVHPLLLLGQVVGPVVVEVAVGA
jgi:hypothetical protein